jgi:Ni,Fe-hydrogenase III large subunit
MFGLIPDGHPGARNTVIHANWPKHKYPLQKEMLWNERPPMTPDFSYPFFEVQGEGIYQIPVGPVHAGIIEPGHFVFSVLGEEIQQLDAQLGYVHKGVEKLFEHLPGEKHLELAEHISGDSSVSHALAYTQALESLHGLTIPKRAAYLRVIYAELERLANHLNDIGFIMLDTAYAFGGANGSRLREEIMGWAERLTKSRFMRKTIIVGGVAHDISKDDASALMNDMKKIEKDFAEVMHIAEKSITLANRIENTGVLKQEIAKNYGVVGVPLRAVGVAEDTRKDLPYAAYPELSLAVATRTEGDVSARMWVKVYEVYASFGLIREALAKLPSGNIVAQATKDILPNTTGVGVVEGWRGNIVYVIKTDTHGKISRVKVRDPSFLNWQAFPHVVVGEMVPDFPLCNKSFNLSYTGNDL